jgi:hypothetical protein
MGIRWMKLPNVDVEGEKARAAREWALPKSSKWHYCQVDHETEEQKGKDSAPFNLLLHLHLC